MSVQLLLYSYLIAAAAAVALLFLLGAKSWHIHALGMLAGALAGLTPPPPSVSGDFFYLAAGVTCVFFLVWGAGGLLFRGGRRIRA